LTNTAPAQLIPFFIGVATQKSQTDKFACVCFVSCVQMLSFGFSVFVVHLVSHVLLFLYSRRSSRRVLRICGTAGDPLVCRSLSPQRTLQRSTSQRLIVQLQHRLGKALSNSQLLESEAKQLSQSFGSWGQLWNISTLRLIGTISEDTFSSHKSLPFL